MLAYSHLHLNHTEVNDARNICDLDAVMDDSTGGREFDGYKLLQLALHRPQKKRH